MNASQSLCGYHSAEEMDMAHVARTTACSRSFATRFAPRSTPTCWARSRCAACSCRPWRSAATGASSTCRRAWDSSPACPPTHRRTRSQRPRSTRSLASSRHVREKGPPLGLLASRRVQLGVEESAQLIEARRRGAPRLVEHRLRRCLELPLEAALGRRCCDLDNRDVSVLAGTSTLCEQQIRHHGLALHHFVEHRSHDVDKERIVCLLRSGPHLVIVEVIEGPM